MTNQKLFEALQRVCGFTALETDMFEIIKAVESDKIPLTETIEQAAERYRRLTNKQMSVEEIAFKEGAKWQRSQPNPHKITEAKVFEVIDLWKLKLITFSRMVEILNEIAAGKHKERIEL